MSVFLIKLFTTSSILTADGWIIPITVMYGYPRLAPISNPTRPMVTGYGLTITSGCGYLITIGHGRASTMCAGFMSPITAGSGCLVMNGPRPELHATMGEIITDGHHFVPESISASVFH